MPAQDGLRFLFQIQDKITADLIKIEKKVKASATKIDKAFTRASKAQEANSARIIHREKLRGIAVENASAKATAARTKETAQGKILAQRLAAAQSAEARRAESFRVASAKRVAKELQMAERQVLKNSRTTFKKIGAAMHKLGTVGRLALGAFGFAAAKMGEDVEKGLQAVQAGTGATGDKLDQLKDSFKTAAGSVPQSTAIMGVALASLSTLTGATGEVLEDLTIRTADASRLWGGDAANNAKLLGGAMKQWQVPAERGADLIDTLGSVSQQYGVNLDKLLTTTNEYSAVLINAGFSMDESVDLFGRLEGAGISVSRVMPGLNAAFRKWADAGKDSRVELARVVDQISVTTDAQKALSIATETFGAEGAQRMVTAIRTGQIPSLSDLAVSLDDVSGTLDTANDGSKTFGERMTQLQNKIAAAVPPAALQAFGSLALAMGTLGPLVATVGGLFVKGAANIVKYVAGVNALKIATAALRVKMIAMAVAQKAIAVAQWLINVAMTANPIGLVIAAIGLLVVAWLKWDDEIKAFFRVTWSLVKKGFYAFKGWVVEAFGVLKGWLDKIPTPILALLGPVGMVLTVFRHWDDIKEIARSVYRGIRTWLGDRLGYIFKGIKKGIDSVVGFFGDMKDVIVGNSIVPDMVDDVESEFERMNLAMVSEVAEATRVTTVEFGKLQTGLHEAAVVMSTELYEAAKVVNEKEIELAESTRKLDEEQRAATQSASGYDLALAGLSGQMGGATGQALNLVIAMREHNKAQKAAAEAGRETEGEFSKIQQGAAMLGLAFTAIGDAIGGTAGKVLSELGGIAQAFATGGIVGGIMAGIGSLIKGIKGLFGRGKRKREKAAAEEKARLAEVAAAAEEAAERMAAAAEKAAAKIKAYWDSIYNSAISAYDQAQAAGQAAYDEIMDSAGDSASAQIRAMLRATDAQEAAIAKVLAAEGEKFARLAAFEAALEAIRSGNAAGAADAAVLAAAQTRAAWETAMDAVKVADQAAGDSMIDTAKKVAAIQEEQAKVAAAAQVAAAAAAKNAWTWTPPDQNTDPNGIPGGFKDPEGYQGFQHGGPVQAGRPVLVGEAGPEIFIPSQSGRIDPNVSNSGGGLNAEDIARAVAKGLQGAKFEADGRKFGRLVVRHQPLASVELGGRR